MLDNYGPGIVMAYLTYVLVIIFGIALMIKFIKRKEFLKAVFSTSVFANLFFYMYFMGKYFFYPKYIYLFINNYWPIINGALLAWLIWDYYRNKK